MKLYRTKAIILRHLYDARHNLDRIVEMFYWPILDVVIWGFFTFYMSANYQLGTNIVSFLLGAIILWGIFYGFQRDLAVGLLEEIWSRNFSNLFSTPLTIWEYLTGLISISIFKMFVGFMTASLIAFWLYTFNIFHLLLIFLPFILNLLIFAAAVGICITSLILRYSTRIQILVWSFAGLLQPVSCVFYPMNILPSWLQSIAWFLPTAHSFEGMRQVFAQGTFSSTHFWWGFVPNILYFSLAIVIFKTVFENARKKGLLVKLA